MACPESLGTDIYGIGTAVDGLHANVGIAGRGQELDMSNL